MKKSKVLMLFLVLVAHQANQVQAIFSSLGELVGSTSKAIRKAVASSANDVLSTTRVSLATGEDAAEMAVDFGQSSLKNVGGELVDMAAPKAGTRLTEPTAKVVGNASSRAAKLMKEINEKIKEIGKKINEWVAAIKKALSKGASPEEIKGLENKLNTINENKQNLKNSVLKNNSTIDPSATKIFEKEMKRMDEFLGRESKKMDKLKKVKSNNPLQRELSEGDQLLLAQPKRLEAESLIKKNVENASQKSRATKEMGEQISAAIDSVDKRIKAIKNSIENITENVQKNVQKNVSIHKDSKMLKKLEERKQDFEKVQTIQEEIRKLTKTYENAANRDLTKYRNAQASLQDAAKGGDMSLFSEQAIKEQETWAKQFNDDFDIYYKNLKKKESEAFTLLKKIEGNPKNLSHEERLFYDPKYNVKDELKKIFQTKGDEANTLKNNLTKKFGILKQGELTDLDVNQLLQQNRMQDDDLKNLIALSQRTKK